MFADSSRSFGLSCMDFSGQLVIGNSPLQYNTWQGELLGLAIYDHQLSSETVSKHYTAWTQHRVPDDLKDEGMFALYSFVEQSGRTIHSSAGSAPDLYIPETFTILH